MGPDFNWSNPVLTSTMLPDSRSLCHGVSSTPLYQNISMPPLFRPNNATTSDNNQTNNNNRVGVCRPIVSMTTDTEFWECEAKISKTQYDVPRPVDVRSLSDTDAVSQYCFASKLSAEEQALLRQTRNFLDQCLFYYKDFEMEEARQRLNNYDVGTFLLRPSSDPNFLLSISVKTSRGTTAVRISFKNMKFSLDSDPHMRQSLPTFDSIPSLVDSYMKLATSVHKNRVVFLEASGRKDTPITLTKPCLRLPGSLRHLCRVVIHGSCPAEVLHQLPGSSTTITDFLQMYPHSV